MYAASFSGTPKHEMRSGDGRGKDKITAAACIMIYLRALRCAARRFTAAVTLANVVAPRYRLARAQPVLNVSRQPYTHRLKLALRARNTIYWQIAMPLVCRVGLA